MSKAQIITRITPEAEPPTRPEWQHLLANAITEPDKLLQALELPTDLLAEAHLADRIFRLKVTQSYLARMEKGNPSDPLLLQVLPQLAETAPQPEHHSEDPVGDQDAMPVPGLLHKYHGRVLLITTGACAIHCRYCFRREFPYQDAQAARNRWQESIDYISADSSIEEVILSGGDPLVLSDNKLVDLTDRLAAIPHLRRLRIHSRLPIVLPQRITKGLLNWLRNIKLQAILVIHSNHPKEIGSETSEALRRLHGTGIALLNQSVLLRHINDDVETLAALSKSLFENGTLPYYLHTLDPVSGAAHFAVSSKKAMEIYDRLSTKLPGYLLPRLASEIPGMPAKTILTGFTAPFG